MPTYEYLCSACENHFEQVQKINDDALKKCPKCGKDELKRLINAAAFHLKGSGWYKTDYASSSSSSQSGGNTSSSNSAEPSNNSTSNSTDSTTPTKTSESSSSTAPASNVVSSDKSE